MPPQTLNIQPLLDQAKSATEQYRRSGNLNDLFRVINLYGKVNNILMGELKQSANGSPMDSLINTAGRNTRAGDHPPHGLMMKIQIATQAHQTWLTCLRSCADSKGQIQGELARFR